MVIDKENRIVSMNGIVVDLTGKEFDLLFFLASNKGRVYTKKQIYTQVWEEEYAFDDNNIMSFISKLRKKIEGQRVPTFPSVYNPAVRVRTVNRLLLPLLEALTRAYPH